MKMNATCRSITLESSFMTLSSCYLTHPTTEAIPFYFCHYSVAFPVLKFPINGIVRDVMSCVCLHSLSLMPLRFSHCAILFTAQEQCPVLVYG